MSDVVARLRGAGYKVKNKRQWDSRYLGTYALRLRSKPVDFPVDHFFAHITVTEGKGDEGVREVEQIGMDRFGSAISYNWVVCHSNHTIYVGMPLGAKGAHTVNDKKVAGFPENLNYHGHAVAFLGMPGDEFCLECAELFAAIAAAERIEGVARDTAKFLPHSQFAAKDCPTDAVRDKLKAINALTDAMVKVNLAVGAPETRVERAKAQLEAVLAELDKVPVTRVRVHKAKKTIKEATEKLPER